MKAFHETDAHAQVTGKKIKRDYVDTCRKVVDQWLETNDTVCMDDVYLLFPDRPEGVHHNIGGAILNSSRYVHTGNYRRSRREGHKGVAQGVWQQKDGVVALVDDDPIDLEVPVNCYVSPPEIDEIVVKEPKTQADRNARSFMSMFA